MHWLEAIGLGVLQGATEFLPVSSSGHLRIAGALFGQEEPDLLFDIILHLGTLLAVIVVYRKDLVGILAGIHEGVTKALRGGGLSGLFGPEGTRLAALIVLATLPTAIIGKFLNDLVDSPFFSLPVVGGLLLVNGALLLSSRLAPTGRAEAGAEAAEEASPQRGGLLSLWNIGMWQALLIGVAQGIAVLPGISRSGLTITVALFLAVRRQEAARYSFLLSIPAILGALVLKLGEAAEKAGGLGGAEQWAQFGVGALASFLVGWVCLLVLMQVLRRAQFHHFAWYCFGIGALALVWHFAGA